MKIEKNGSAIVFLFGRGKYLKIDRVNGVIEYWEDKIPFHQVIGYWKNYRPRGRKFLFYVMLLTRNRLHRITPEMKDEDSVEKILDVLRDTIPVEVKE